jgi:hypothetical protein
MTETVKALSVEKATQQISDYIAAYLEGGPNRKAESIELAKAVGLNLERISARWDDAEDYLLLTPPAPREPKAAEVERVAPDDRSTAEGWGRRRSLAPDRSEPQPKDMMR